MKEEILRVAADKMQDVGIRSLSIDDICRLLGISKKTFYVYFETKEALVEAILRRQERMLTTAAMRSSEGKTTAQLVASWMHTAPFLKEQIHQTPPLLYDLRKYYPAQFDRHQDYLRTWVCRFLERLFVKGIEEGFFRADIDVPLTSMFIANVHHNMVNASIEHPEQSPEVQKINRQAMEIIMRGVITQEGLKTLLCEKPLKDKGL
ncbi:MAG: TetR/AcrR family transcriptional regulator [Paludibacteraceae bacterium]